MNCLDNLSAKVILVGGPQKQNKVTFLNIIVLETVNPKTYFKIRKIT